MKATIEQQIAEIKNVVESNRFVSDRVSTLKELGYDISEFAMGSGGVIQVKEMQNEYRVQIESGHGKYNYARSVVLSK